MRSSHVEEANDCDAGLLLDQRGGACDRAERAGDGRRDVRHVRCSPDVEGQCRAVRLARIRRIDGGDRHGRIYLGIDTPRLPVEVASARPKLDPVEWLSAAGTFLAAVAALVSVYGIVLDEVPQRFWEFMFGSWWTLGIAMQIGAGLIARLRPAGGARVRSVSG